MRKSLLAVLASAILVPLSTHAGVIPITVANGSFEFPGAAATWNSLPSVSQYSGWSDTSSSPYQIYNTNDGQYFSAGADGGHYALNTPGGTLSNDLGYSLSVGETVTLTFAIGKTYATTNGGQAVQYGTGLLTADIFSGSALIGTGAFSSTAAGGSWDTISLTGVATVAGDLSIQFVNAAGDAPWLDAVTASVTTAPVVPEPATMPLLVVGAVAAFMFARRKGTAS